MNAFDLRDRDAERLSDCGFDQALAQADAHLTRDDLDEEARRLGVHSPHHRFEWFGFRIAASGADRFQRRLHVGERDLFGFGAAVEGFACPVAEIRMLAKYVAQLVLVAT